MVALIAIILKAGVDVLGPYLTKVAIDKYLANRPAAPSWLDRYLSSQPMTGIAQIAAHLPRPAACQLPLRVHADVHHAVGRTEGDVRPAGRNLPPPAATAHRFLRPQSRGRLVTRVTSDVDALNEMFTAGVVSIFEDIFVLIGHHRHHAQHELAAGADHVRGTAHHLLRHLAVPQSGARELPAHSHRHRQDQRVPARARNRHRRFAALWPRKTIVRAVREDQPHPHGRVQRRDPGACDLLSRGRSPVGHGDRLRHLVRRQPGDPQCGQPRRAGGVHAVRAALLPSDPGPEREVQHPAIGHGVERAHLQAARHQGRNRFAADSARFRDGPGRIEFDHVWFAYRTLAQAAEEAPAKARS